MNGLNGDDVEPELLVAHMHVVVHTFRKEKRFRATQDVLIKTSKCLCTPSLLGVSMSKQKVILGDYGRSLHECGQQLKSAERDQLLRHFVSEHGIMFPQHQVTSRNVCRTHARHLMLIDVGLPQLPMVRRK
jgi:hypothetical protein